MMNPEIPVDSVVMSVAGRLTREGLRAWLDRKPPPKQKPEYLEFDEEHCAWCDDERKMLVEGTGRDWGFWFEPCRGCR